MTAKTIISKPEPTTRQDLVKIRSILQAAKTFAFNNRYGGSWEKWEKTKSALHALDRIEKELLDRQMKLL